MKKLFMSVLQLSILLSIVIVLNCAKRLDVPTEQLSASDISSETVDESDISAYVATERYIYPGDHLRISIYEKLPISDEKKIEIKRVDRDGKVYLSPLGKVRVAGFTIRQIEKGIEELLAQYIISPYCEIELEKSERRVYVYGEVERPGVQELKPGLTVLDVLSSSKIADKAYQRSIKIIRLNDNKVTMITVDLKEMFKDGVMDNNLRIKNNDIVYVPSRFISNVKEVLGNIAKLNNAIFPWYLASF